MKKEKLLVVPDEALDEVIGGFSIRIGGSFFIGIAIGLATGAGLVHHSHKKKQKKLEKQRELAGQDL